jgi:hypothetical protein
VLNKVASIRGRQPRLYRFHKSRVIFPVAAEDLLRQFVGLQSPPPSDLGRWRFFFGLQWNFDG